MDTPPPPVQMVQLLAGFQLSQALYAAAKVGIPDQLAGGPRTPEEVAAVLQTDPLATGRLLRALAAAAPSGARVRALELVAPPGDGPHMSKMIDLTMLGMLTGRERDEEELRALVEEAGLRFDGVASTPTPMSVVEARVP